MIDEARGNLSPRRYSPISCTLVIKMFSKDYYAILGVTPSAEDVVIRAAYKALAQRYHPDRYKGNPLDAERLMKDINEAYAVLADTSNKRKYDEWYKQKNKQSEFKTDEEEELNKAMKAASADWEIACSIHSDLLDIENRLSKFSSRLASTYRLYLLETKKFDSRLLISQAMTKEFLETHFGSNKDIVDFAEYLILNGHRDAAKALNDYVRVLGQSVDSEVAINKICAEYILIYPAEQNKIITKSPYPETRGLKKTHKLGMLFFIFIILMVFLMLAADAIYRADMAAPTINTNQEELISSDTGINGKITEKMVHDIPKNREISQSFMTRYGTFGVSKLADPSDYWKPELEFFFNEHTHRTKYLNTMARDWYDVRLFNVISSGTTDIIPFSYISPCGSVGCEGSIGVVVISSTSKISVYMYDHAFIPFDGVQTSVEYGVLDFDLGYPNGKRTIVSFKNGKFWREKSKQRVAIDHSKAALPINFSADFLEHPMKIFFDPAANNKLLMLLGDDYSNFRENMYKGNPTALIGEYYVGGGCKSGDCNSNSAYFAIHKDTELIYACIESVNNIKVFGFAPGKTLPDYVKDYHAGYNCFP